MNNNNLTFIDFTNFCKQKYNNTNSQSSILVTEYVPFHKAGNKIHIKKENEGKFTAYCNGKVTDACIQKGKNSSDPKIRKRATFAANARVWNHVQKHQLGGIMKFLKAARVARAIDKSLNLEKKSIQCIK